MEESLILLPRARRCSTGTFRIQQYTAKDIKTDFAVADAMQRVGRKISEDYPGIGEYLASLAEEFQRMERARVYMALRQKARDAAPASLERRVELWREGNEWCIDDAPGHLIHPPDEIFSMFTRQTPSVIDDSGLKLVFGNMNIDDDKYEIRDSHGQRDGSSLALMPFYYRDRRHASGIVLFEGDLRCKDSEVSGFSKMYWTARLAMEMASQLSYKLTHEFDAITSLRRVQDFEVDIRHGIKETMAKGNELCLMLIDLDKFKSINEQAGYKGGNAVLREVAEVIKGSVRSDDCAARLGGDEFSVVLKRVSWPEALAIAERIMENIRRLKVPFKGSSISITCSMGAVNVKRIAEEMGLLGHEQPTDAEVEKVYKKAFSRSNGLLIDAKNGGRGKVLSA
ncbi:MAG: GGDEF domain-containing protein [Candidatus Micrarchaeota archaeon]